MVVLASSLGCTVTSLLGGRCFQSLQTTFLERVCDTMGKSQAWRGLDVALPSHFVMVA